MIYHDVEIAQKCFTVLRSKFASPLFCILKYNALHVKKKPNSGYHIFIANPLRKLE